MKSQKEKVIIIVCSILILGIVWLLTTDKYIRGNIITIDKADGINIIAEDRVASYPFDERLIKLVSYGGFVVKVDKFFVGLFSPYSNNLTKINMDIRYTQGDSTLAIAQVFKSNENSQEYILYMNNVYWQTHSKLIDVLELIE